jgi:hypothetical protein
MKTLKNLKILIGLILITSCSCEPIDIIIQDRCLQREIFKECMNSLPAGPVSTHYNDWDEVVEACGNVARSHSRKKRSVVKIECQGD